MKFCEVCNEQASIRDRITIDSPVEELHFCGLAHFITYTRDRWMLGAEQKAGRR